MTRRRTRGASSGDVREARGGLTAPRLPGRLVVAAVVLVSVASLATGLVLLARGPDAERLPASQQLATAQAPRADPSRTPSPEQSPKPSTRSTRTTGWPVRSAAIPKPTKDPHGVPTRLDVAALGLELPIQPTGVDDRGAMALPPVPGHLGWYRYSSRPGDDSGATVLGGHVDSKVYGTGPLVELWRLEAGDTLVVQTTKGPVTYVVTAVQRIAKTEIDPAVVFARSGAPVLRLLTCGGPYLPAKGGYQDNVVVTAKPR
ncbi:LPXTG-site transpeptidase (sortase) family protein [Friedmanniella endophytica]|uniref:LPXTG-site transpeptidase (Sortase) family protein n=1 Tax=Microlunatus kandeliicorticis TaxID=1759536 RepID=A0A7W3IS31_9ACTN|nr:class F sortase [Microlunatus kandeliicorticis]MBA8794216.1 LPXTG-site transpeptidase (sortase) family protein [Microlunatus kandeliicorticis]